MSDWSPKTYVVISLVLSVAFGVGAFWLSYFLNPHSLLSQNRVLDATYVALGLNVLHNLYVLYIFFCVPRMLFNPFQRKKDPDLALKLLCWIGGVWIGTTFGIASGWLINPL